MRRSYRWIFAFSRLASRRRDQLIQGAPHVEHPPPRFSTLIALVLIAGLGQSAAFAEVKTWDGGGGTDNTWLNDANWNPNGVPTEDDDVRIDSASNGVLFEHNPDSPTFNFVTLPEDFDFRFAKTIEIGTGTQQVTVVMEPYTIFSVQNASGSLQDSMFTIGSNGTLRILEAAMIAGRPEAPQPPYLFGNFFSTTIQNNGLLEIYVPTTPPSGILLKGDFDQSANGITRLVLPAAKPAPDARSLEVLGTLGGADGVLEGAIDIGFLVPPTMTGWPTSLNVVPYVIFQESAFTHEKFEDVTVNGQEVVNGRTHPRQPDGTFVGSIVAEFIPVMIEPTKFIFQFRAAILGDMNGDGVLDTFDVAPFEQALFDPATYDATFPLIDRVFVGDINNDGVVNAFDVAGFEQLLTGQGLLIDPQVFVQMLEALMIE